MADWFCDKQVVNFFSSFPLPNTASVYVSAGGGGLYTVLNYLSFLEIYYGV